MGLRFFADQCVPTAVIQALRDTGRTYAIRNNARRIWASTPQNCATTNHIAFEKHTYFQGLSVGSPAIYRLSA